MSASEEAPDLGHSCPCWKADRPPRATSESHVHDLERACGDQGPQDKRIFGATCSTLVLSTGGMERSSMSF